MSDLKSIEKAKLENFFQMDSGYVCDFAYSSYKNFFIETVDIDIFTDRYTKDNSGSKASRMRSFWILDSNQIVGKLVDEMLDYWKSQLEIGIYGYRPFNQKLYDQCKQIVVRINSIIMSVSDASALIPNSSDKDFGLLADYIKKSIESGELELALDRLHTFVVKYLRVLCKKHGLNYDKNTPLNALIGGYTKFLHDNKILDSDMSIQILKSSIKVLESFDFVRNNQSLAHDNPILNREESTLIFSHVSNSIRFIKSIEDQIEGNKVKYEKNDSEDREPTEEEIEAAGDAWIEMEIERRRGK